MDPLSTVALVANIVQFVDFGGKVISTAGTLYRSTTGTLDENIDIETATNDLIAMNNHLKTGFTSGDAELERLCEACNKVAELLLQRLEKVKVNGKHRRLKSIQIALKSCWSEDEIDELSRRLAALRDEFNFRLIVGLRDQACQLRSEQSHKFDNLDLTAKRILDAIIQQDDVFRVARDAQAELVKTEHETTRQTVIQAIQQNEDIVKIRQWLCAPDPSSNYQKAIKERHHGTGRWFLEGEQYIKWKTDAASFVWLYGIPGCGKTILSSAVVEDILLGPNVGAYSTVVAYFYFDFKDSQKQASNLMIKSLVLQLAHYDVQIPVALKSLFSSCANGTQEPSIDASLGVLKQMMQGPPDSYIVLDALDECDDRTELMDIIETIVGWQLEKSHILVTSRKEQDIELTLETLVNPTDAIYLQAEVVDKDIRRYVVHQLSTNKSLAKWCKHNAICQEIETALIQKSQGMFRWAVCQLDALAKCRNQLQLRKALATLPSTLDATYERILLRIDSEDSEYAIRILNWLAFSALPLRLDELAEVVAIDVNADPAFNPEEVLVDPWEVLAICSSLVTVTTAEDNSAAIYADYSPSAVHIVALSHYSVKEYLTSDRIQRGHASRYGMQEGAGNAYLATSCLGYLLQFRDPVSFCQETIETSKLALYSARFWHHHARGASPKSDTLMNRFAMKLFSLRDSAFLNSFRIYDLEQPLCPPNIKRNPDRLQSPLYYVSLAGLADIVRLLIQEAWSDVNARGGAYGNPLQAASAAGHQQVVELLLQAGADVNMEGGVYGNALQAASLQGHEHVVRLLLQAEGDVKMQGGILG